MILFCSGYFLGLPEKRMIEKETDDSKEEESPKLNLQSSKFLENQISLQTSTLQEVSFKTPDDPNKSEESIKEFLLRAQAESNPILRNASFAQALGNLNADNLEDVLETFKSLPFGFEHIQEYRMLLYAWGQFDPLAAIDYCKERASGIGAGFATAGVLEGWASRDPQSALTWVKSPENAGMAKLYNFGLIRGWASSDLDAASNYAERLEGNEDLNKISGILIDQNKKQGGFAQASSWANSLANGHLKEGAFSSMSRKFARDQPEKLAEWMKIHANEKYAANAFENLGKRWSETDPKSSIEYFSNLPRGKSQELGIKGSISNWAKQDPVAAGEWLNQRDSGPQLDSALAAYASTVSIIDGGAAMEWAVSISDFELQTSVIKKVGQEWYRQDKDAVDIWLPESGLSKEEQKKIRNPPKKNWWQRLQER